MSCLNVRSSFWSRNIGDVSAPLARTNGRCAAREPILSLACPVRKIDTRDFRRATRTTSREINRRIVLNLVRDHQPLSRADLARRMEIGRGVVTSIVQELIDEGTIYEGDVGAAA